MRNDGGPFTAEYILTPIYEEDLFKGATLVFRDISLRKEYEESIANQQQKLEQLVMERTQKLSIEIKKRALMEKALSESQSRLMAITTSLFEAVLLVDLTGHIIFANPSAHRLLKADTQKLPGTEIDDAVRLCVGKTVLSFADSPLHDVIKTGETLLDDDAIFVLANGEKLSVAYACSPLMENNKRQCVIISFRSISALKDAQKEAAQASRLASVGQLAAGIAHEINTPIQYVGDNLRFISESLLNIDKVIHDIENMVEQGGVAGETAAKIRQLFEDIDLNYLLEEMPLATKQSLEGVEHVSKIVRSMKEFSHPGSTAKVATDINRAIASTVTVSTNEWKHVAKLETHLAPDLPPILCFPADINQVLLNLIINASHAIESLGQSELGLIGISTRLDGDWIEIRVSDTGPGVPKEIQDKIYDPFFTTKAVGKGTGQGLAISFDVIVNKHKGKIFLDQQNGSGATFVVRLPVGGLDI